MKKPTQCVLWNRTGLTPEDLNLEMVKVFIRSDHIERNLFKCRECGQLYFHEWYEHINFKHDDDMYDTYIPVETDEDINTLLEAKSSADLAKFLPQLHGSYTNNQNDSLRWIEKREEEEV